MPQNNFLFVLFIIGMVLVLVEYMIGTALVSNIEEVKDENMWQPLRNDSGTPDRNPLFFVSDLVTNKISHGGERRMPTTTSSKSTSPKRGQCLVVLTTNSSEDIRDLSKSLKSIQINLVEVNKTPATLLIFNEGNLNTKQRQLLIGTVHPRRVLFPVIDFDSYPPHFDPITEVENWSKRKKWGYQQMCRFWAYRIWLHKDLYENCETYMRFDTDSCFSARITLEYLPGLPANTSSGGYFAYVANEMSRDEPFVSEGLHDLVQSYIYDHKVHIKNPELYKRTSELEMLFTNFEVANVTWFRQDHVLSFLKRIVEEEPYGVLRKREFVIT